MPMEVTPDSSDPCLMPLTSRCYSVCFMFTLTSREALFPGWRWFDLWHELFALVTVWLVMAQLLPFGSGYDAGDYLATSLSVEQN